MTLSEQYPYPINNKHPYPIVRDSLGENQVASKANLLGTPVEIKKGSLKGTRGKISGCTSDGAHFFIQCEGDYKMARRVPPHVGPFLWDEFNLI